MRELVILALTIQMEAGCQGFDGKFAVATTIENRRLKSGKSYSWVCLQRKQYSCWNRYFVSPKLLRGLLATFSKHSGWSDSVKIARAMMSGKFTPMGEWTHYYNPLLSKPKWKNSLVNKTQIGSHLFGYIKE